MTLLTITHYGTPVLWVRAEGLPFRSFGALAITLEKDTLTLHSPDGNTLGIKMPPEIVAHLGTLPGLWIAVVGTDGLVLTSQLAPKSGTPLGEVFEILPEDRRPITTVLHHGQAEAATMAVLDDGIFAAVREPAADRSSDQPTPSPGLPAAWHQLRQELRAFVGRPPAETWPESRGGPSPAVFLPGLDCDRLEVVAAALDRRVVSSLSQRLQAACAALGTVQLNEATIGADLLGVMDTAPVRWLGSDEASRPVAWGWDAASRSVGLPIAADPDWDPVRLAAGLYHAYASISGESVVSRIASSMLSGPSSAMPRLGEDALVDEIALEAGYARELMRFVTVALGLASPRAASDEAFSADNLARATASVRPAIEEHAREFLRAAEAFQSEWFDPRRRVILPHPPHSINIALPQVPRAPDPGGTPAPSEVEITNLRLTLPGPVPKTAADADTPVLTYTAPLPLGSSPIASPVTLVPGSDAAKAKLQFAREDGSHVFATISNAAFLTALRRGQRVTIVCLHPARRDLGNLSDMEAAGIDVPLGEKPYMNMSVPVVTAGDGIGG